DGSFTLAPFDPVPLRALAINGHRIDPGFFDPALPAADLTVALSARVEANRKVSGTLALTNQAAAGTLDQQRLPLRALHGELTGDLSALQLRNVLIDLGAAGQFTGGGSLQRGADTTGLGTARFALHTDRLDLKAIHGRLKSTRIAGDIRIANAGNTQTLDAQLADSGMRLDAQATLAGKQLTLQQARLSAGGSSVRATGSFALDGEQAFRLAANALHFNPASFGAYPAADISADVNAAGALAPAWRVAADFALRPSRLFRQPLSGKGKLTADAAHVSGVAATLALGQNTVDVHGSFGAPGEQLLWRLEGKQLSALRSGLYGTLAANGALTGTMAAPRTSFEIDAAGLGWTPAARAANASRLHASGEAWLAAHAVEVKASGAAQRFNPAAFGAFLPGSINGSFNAAGRSGPDWHGTLDLALQDSTLSNSPLWGHAKLAADAHRIANADIDLHVGPNILAARGSFGTARDQLEWRIDAGQLAAIGPDFAGALRGSGSLSGTMTAPSLSAALEGQNLRLPGGHQLKALRASASVASGRGADDPLVSDIELTNYVHGETHIASARLQTSGTRAAHSLRLAARGDDFDALAEVRGGWNANAWSGTVATLQNRGRYAFALQAPAPLTIAAPPGSGVLGLTRPERIALSGAVIKLPEGSIRLQTLDKNGPRWSSKGAAAGVPLNYLAQFSTGMRDNVSGDLTLGADWTLDLQTAAATGAAPALAGSVHVFREKGDLTVGAEVPVVLGLRQLDLRADVTGGALRVQGEINGARAGHARVDATAQMIAGRLGNDSPLKLSADADMGSIAWLAPLSGQPALELDGALKLALTAGGTVGAPTLNGSMSGDRLALRWADQGVKLRNGVLRAQLAGDQLQLQQLSFDGMQGRATADGFVRFAGGEASMQLKLVADHLEMLSRPDRTVVVTGQSTLVRDAKRFTLEGKFKADRALVELAPLGRPTMSDDVI
ncbi:MAG TPA: translocation/assembly module TamB domain-containing protein, partial [Telluria sp.]|nr:translocation/assembly module TamB domain-containing protein [Telluria sp.]